jgi:hypothetical protein
VAPVRQALDDITVAIASTIEPSSTTIAMVGAYVVVVATTLPDRAVGLTSCYLGELEGETAVSHLHLGPGPRERLSQRILEAGQPGVTHARICLLDHAADLRAAVSELTEEHVTVDVGTHALDRAAQAWTQPS